MALSQPFMPIQETGIVELVGIDDKVDQNDFGDSIALYTFVNPPASGEIRAFAFYATEDGTGAVQDSAGELLIFDADPATAFGDTSITAAERLTQLGRIVVSASDWTTDANGGIAYINTKIVPFHPVTALYVVWKQTDGTGLNDAAGDDEQLEMNAWFVRYS